MKTQSLGEFIRAKRDESDISLRELARQIEVSPPFLSDIELGRRYPSEPVLQKIATCLKVPIEVLQQYDPRGSFNELKRLIAAEPKLSFAFRTAVEDVRQGRMTVDDLTKKLSSKDGEGAKEK